jgi:hypothetical protein
MDMLLLFRSQLFDREGLLNRTMIGAPFVRHQRLPSVRMPP